MEKSSICRLSHMRKSKKILLKSKMAAKWPEIQNGRQNYQNYDVCMEQTLIINILGIFLSFFVIYYELYIHFDY